MGFSKGKFINSFFACIFCGLAAVAFIWAVACFLFKEMAGPAEPPWWVYTIICVVVGGILLAIGIIFAKRG